MIKQEEGKAVHQSPKWVYLQEDPKDSLSKNCFTLLLLNTIISQRIR